jgi:hypothetical protein
MDTPNQDKEDKNKAAATVPESHDTQDVQNEKFKYHAVQIKEDKEHADEYPDKPKNHTTNKERLLNPDRGE